MQDFPVFDTEFGIASLILKEVPYRQEAYIIIQSTQQPEELLRECVAFCRMVGAERIYARGHEYLERFPLHTVILEMHGEVRTDGKPENLFPVTQQTAAKWRGIYNESMRGVDNSATLEARDEKKLLESGGAYFVHRDGSLLGIGWLEDNKLLAIAATQPGAGERVLGTLMTLIPAETMTLEVASTNKRAIRFYEKMGFLTVGEVNRWYRVTGEKTEKFYCCTGKILDIR